MKRTYIFTLLFLIVSCDTTQKTDQLNIDDIITQSLQLDNTDSKTTPNMEKDVSSRSLSKELSKAFSKIIASTPLKSENIPTSNAELDNLKQEDTHSEVTENKSEASHLSSEESHKSSVDDGSVHEDSQRVDLNDETLTDDKSITVDSSNKTGLEASTVSTPQSTHVEEASVKSKVSQLSQLEDQNEMVDNLETLPVDKDEEEQSIKEQDLNGIITFSRVNK